MGQVVRYQEILRRLAIIDDGFVEDSEWLGLGPARTRVLDAKTVALVQVGALAAIGSPAVCLEWSASRALAAGATEDEITDVLLAIAPVAGLGREPLPGRTGRGETGRLAGRPMTGLAAGGGSGVRSRWARRRSPARGLGICGTGWSRWIS